MSNLAANNLVDIVAGSVLFTLLILLLSVLVLVTRSLVMGSSSYNILLNRSTSIPAAGGSQLLRDLNDAGVPVPSGCAGTGTCGLCKVQLQGEQAKPTPPELARLTRTELKKGMRLACQVKVRHDLQVTVSENILVANDWECEVLTTRQLSPLIKEITLQLPDDSRMDFEPGGYVQVSAPAYKLNFASMPVEAAFKEQWAKLDTGHMRAGCSEEVTRAYSLANKPEETNSVVLLIRLALPPPAHYYDAPAGTVSSWLFSRKPGDLVKVNGPYGDFRLHPTEREMVLIGGGVGMAPLRSILHEELQSDRTRPISFYYGARSQWDIFYDDEISSLMKRHPRFSYELTLSEPSAQLEWDGSTGFVHETLEQDFLDSHLNPDECDYYLCGPPLMQQAVISALDDAGVDADSIFADSFG